MDVKVPQLKRQVRVRKTSIVQDDDGQKGERFEDVMAEEPLVGTALLAVCTLLVRRGVRKGDEGLHEAIDMCLDMTLHEEVTLTKEEKTMKVDQKDKENK
jgi:hypothetical protein